MSTTPSTTAKPPKPPLVAIIGTTGVGKSQLGIDLARWMAGRPAGQRQGLSGADVINADSMQVYKGLDVITNKVTEEEKQGVPHHLMGFLEPGEEYKVGDFQRDAIAKIDELGARDTLPIAVGGTTYYLQHLIFPNSLVADAPPPSRPASPTNHTPDNSDLTLRTTTDLAHFPTSLRNSILALPAELLELFLLLPALPQTSTPDAFPPTFPIDRLPPAYAVPEAFTSACFAILTAVDPASAARWHWRDIRKVRRALEIVWEGRRWEDVRRAQEENAKDAEGARFRTLVFWLFAEKPVLDERLDKRVDKMMDLGLLDEIHQLWALAHPAGAAATTDYSRGIYQTIGYKEFEPYLTAHAAEEHVAPDPSDALFAAGLESMKASTRQYAKRQVKWITGKLLPEVRKGEEGEVTVVLLDATDLATWTQNVRDPAIDILAKFLAGEGLPDPTTLSPLAAQHLAPPPPKLENGHIKRQCELCTTDPAKPFLVEERSWAAHCNSKQHRRHFRKPRGDPSRARKGGTAQAFEGDA